MCAPEQRLQQDAYVHCALHLERSPPLNNVDIPWPGAMSMQDGSQANNLPPSLLPAQHRSPSSHPEHREAQSDPEQCCTKHPPFWRSAAESAETK